MSTQPTGGYPQFPQPPNFPPPIYPYLPPPRPPQRRRLNANLLVPAIALGIVVVLLLASAVFASLEGRTARGSATVIPTWTPTDTPPPTPTLTALDNGPFLGAVDDAFVSLLGGSSPSIGATDSTVAGHHVQVGFQFTAGWDSRSRIRAIEVYAGDATMTTQTVPGIMGTFLPPDAKHVRDVTKDVTQYGTVVHHVYYSALLANTLQQQDFIDDLDLTTPTPLGTFEWFCFSYHGWMYGPYSGCIMWTWAPR